CPNVQGNESMRRLFVALIATVLMLAAVQAAAAGVPVLGTQTAGQDAPSGQMAGALSGTDQALPANGDLAAPVLSPTGGGTVAHAGNANDADQNAGQTQLAGGSGDATQSSGQAAGNEQAALADSKTVQVAPNNDNISVRVLSPGDNGSVTQSNTASSAAAAGN